MNGFKNSRPVVGLLKGGLLAAFTAAAVMCGAGAAQAGVYTFDLTGPSSSHTFDIDGAHVTVSSRNDEIDLNPGANWTVIASHGGDVASFGSTGAIGQYSDYRGRGGLDTSTLVETLVKGDRNGVTTDLSSSGYIALFLGRDKTPAWLSYTNTIEFGPELAGHRSENDVFTITGFGTVGPIAGVPEPDAWALMIVGVGALGLVLRRKRSLTVAGVAAA